MDPGGPVSGPGSRSDPITVESRDVHEDVHVGREGWLFLVGGSNHVLRQYRRSWRSWWHDRRWARLIGRRARRLRRLGIAYAHLVVPEKLTVYDHRLDRLAVDVSAAPAVRLRERMRRSSARACLVDLVAPLRAQRDAGPLYLRTDSHWSHEGCFVAYAELCRHLGTPPRADLGQGRFWAETDFCGDLGTKLTPRRHETLRLHALQRDAVRVQAGPLVREREADGRLDDLHRGSHVVFRNDDPAADPRRLVLFGDSYANLLWNAAGGMLTGLLAETFREVHFLWAPSVDWGYVEAVAPDIVVTEIAERFTSRLPPFGYRQAVLEERMRALGSSRAGAS